MFITIQKNNHRGKIKMLIEIFELIISAIASYFIADYVFPEWLTWNINIIFYLICFFITCFLFFLIQYITYKFFDL